MKGCLRAHLLDEADAAEDVGDVVQPLGLGCDGRAIAAVLTVSITSCSIRRKVVR